MERPVDDGDDQTTRGGVGRGLLRGLTLVGAAAAVFLVVLGVKLLSDIQGTECHGEYPVCTTYGQQSARQTLAMFCGAGLFVYLVAARPAFRARRFNWAHLLVAIVIALAILALVIDPISHLRSEEGSGQWFFSG